MGVCGVCVGVSDWSLVIAKKSIMVSTGQQQQQKKTIDCMTENVDV